MRIGVIGLGKMGSNLVKNMIKNNIEVVGFDSNYSKEDSPIIDLEVSPSLEYLVESLTAPRIIWLMIPSGDPTNQTIEALLKIMSEGDILIDGGNSFYKNSIDNAKKSEDKGIHFFDCGTSGGIDGALNGGNFMIGGNADYFEMIQPIFEKIAAKDGWLFTGEAGSGHYLKMIHNGIEYGMMQAIGEGFEILENSKFAYNNHDVAKLWNNGSVIRSWLMELIQDSFEEDPQLSSISGEVESSGEGKWTVEEALSLQVPTPVISAALFARYRSQLPDNFSGKVVSSLRNGFGGHKIITKE